MDSKKGLKAPEKLCIIVSLLHFFQHFQEEDLVCRCHSLFLSGFTCTRNASIEAPSLKYPCAIPCGLKALSCTCYVTSS